MAMWDPTARAIAEHWRITGRDEQFPTPQDREQALQAETERLDELIFQLADKLRSQEIEQYRKEHEGNFPPFLETAQIGNRTRAKAEEIVLSQELELTDEQLLADNTTEETAQEEAEERMWQTHPDRWRERPDLIQRIDPEIDRLTDEIWAGRSIPFRVTAACLMQTRYEDNQPYPVSPQDPLVPRFTALVTEEQDAIESRRSARLG